MGVNTAQEDYYQHQESSIYIEDNPPVANRENISFNNTKTNIPQLSYASSHQSKLLSSSNGKQSPTMESPGKSEVSDQQQAGQTSSHKKNASDAASIFKADARVEQWPPSVVYLPA